MAPIDENVLIDRSLVGRLVARQFPQWAHHVIAPIEPGGSDNRTFRLGERMSVRLPSALGYAQQVEKEQRWLPRLAPRLPLPIPTPIARGGPAEGYPWPWSVYRWLEGRPATTERVADLCDHARSLAFFLRALSRVDATAGPLPGAHNFQRGGPPGFYDQDVRRAIAVLGDTIDVDAVTAVWDAALATRWNSPPVWFHGDVSAGNLLVENGRLSAVIDFGTSGIGDPACDLAITWTQFFGESRHTFRTEMGWDAGTWARGRGWALWKALIVAAGFMGADHPEGGTSRRVIDEVIEDHRLFA